MRFKTTTTTGLIAGLTLIAATAFAGPGATVVNDSTWDFGYVPQNAKISHVFNIKSTGDQTLKIVQVIPGCGCTKTPLEKSEIAPGESTKLEVIFNTGQYRGRVTKHPRFVTNEEQAQHTLQFLSTVVMRPDSTYPLIIQPAILDFSGDAGGAGRSMTVTITNVSDSTLGLKLIDFAEGTFDVELPKSIPAGGSAEATVKLVDPKSTAGFEKSFTIQLDDKAADRFTVPVKLTVPKADHAQAPSGH